MKRLKKVLGLISIVALVANSALAFSEACLHQAQVQGQMPLSETSIHGDIAALDEDKPCHETDEIKHLDTPHCDRNCSCIDGMSNHPILAFDLAHKVNSEDYIQLRFRPLHDAPAFFGQTPPERPPKNIS
ncbi:MAG: hypothetical protein HN781_08650 [Betaproteobacteria bacterium]|jgi:hypothetical protein|nr:hypothetical protein [Betaproteobacteria bacterium]MBT6529986.1 hypothetical protein [Betaproteobacteria bacterium]MBT7428009.1 hypothetical protein [Betaproteobacteria bacterium]MBT7998109.1 hypothetical protein [Betaproteobacteria bacterium]